jgi:hypothetical protein
MSSDLGTLFLAVSAAVVVLFVFGAYWGLRVRGVLLDRLYRSRAAWVTMVAVVFALLVISNLAIGEYAPTNWYLSLLQFLLQYSGAAFVFAAVDSTIRVAIRTDPLQRDTLHWRTVRKILWTVVVVTILWGVYQVLALRVNFYTSPGGPQGVLIYGPFGNLFALIALIVARSRSKDYALRLHMKWFSLFTLVLLVASQDLLYRYEEAHLAVSSLLVLGGFFLYLAAKSLVPVTGGTISDLSPPFPPSPGGSTEGKGRPTGPAQIEFAPAP